MSERRPRIVIADDYPRLLAALRRLLEPSCDIVGSVSSGVEAIDAVTTLSPDVVVLDVSMPDINGMDACRRIKQAAPNTRVVLMTAAHDALLEAHALRAGASAFVLKGAAASEMAATIQRVFAANL
jgi:DNA-binding NarL/FixJ family response regulator